MRASRLPSWLALVTVVTGCGGANPASPTAPAVTVLVIAGADTVLTGVSTGYTATATLADATSRGVGPTWSSSNPEVATVDREGLLEGRTHGSTILTAASQGQTGSKTLHVVNNYGGRWEGRFVVKACAPPGLCGAQDVDCFSYDITLQISQAGTDQRDINATLELPDFFQWTRDYPWKNQC
jgi:hypothetical protein